MLYYWAANIRTILNWCHTNSQSQSWLQIEEASCSPSSLMSLVCLPLTPSPIAHSNSVVVKNCLRIWNQFRRHFGLRLIPVRSPVHCNPLFKPSVIDKAFLIWKDLGIVSIKHLYINGIFASFSQLTQAFNLQPTHFFRYLQVRDFVRNHFPGFPALPPSTLTDTILEVNPNLKGSISTLYSTLPQESDNIL